ncbi:MAG: hypothetical protein HYZ71_14025 [Deltaproteobacteria bacterium]|nr:hypothetical protein [Deltaproteobacteria bacterium]
MKYWLLVAVTLVSLPVLAGKKTDPKLDTLYKLLSTKNMVQSEKDGYKITVTKVAIDAKDGTSQYENLNRVFKTQIDEVVAQWRDMGYASLSDGGAFPGDDVHSGQVTGWREKEAVHFILSKLMSKKGRPLAAKLIEGKGDNLLSAHFGHYWIYDDGAELIRTDALVINSDNAVIVIRCDYADA